MNKIIALILCFYTLTALLSSGSNNKNDKANPKAAESATISTNIHNANYSLYYQGRYDGRVLIASAQTYCWNYAENTATLAGDVHPNQFLIIGNKLTSLYTDKKNCYG